MTDKKERRGSNRRQTDTDFRRRKFDRREKTFYYVREIYLNDTNAYGNVYWANFFHAIGECREDFLKWVLGDQVTSFIQSGVGMVTADATIKYKHSLFPFDTIKVRLTIPKLTRTKLFFNFEIRNENTGTVCATATMTIGAVLGAKIIPIPETLTKAIRKHFPV